MKLHLPKMLLTAVLATCVAQTVQADWYGEKTADSWNASSNDDISTSLAVPNSDKNLFIRSGDDGTNLSISSLALTTLNSEYTLNINGHWNDSSKYFNSLTIDSLIFEDGHNGTFKVASTDAAIVKAATGTVKYEIDGKLTLSGAHTFSSAGQLKGTGTLVIDNNSTLIAGSRTSTTKYDFAGKIQVNSGKTLMLGQSGEGDNHFWSLEMKNATIELNGSTIRYFGGDSTIGNITSKGNSSLDLYATHTGATGKTFTIDKLSVTSDTLTIKGKWESTTNIKALTLNGTLLLNADTEHTNQTTATVNISALSGSGMLQAQKGDYVLLKGSHSIGRLDLSKGSTNTGTLTLKEGANLSVSSAMWMRNLDSVKLLLEKNASYSQGEIKVIGLDGLNSSITRNDAPEVEADSDKYDLGSNRFSINNAAVEITSSGNSSTIKNRLNNSSITNKGAGVLTVDNELNTYTAINAEVGSIDIINFKQQTTVNSLTIASKDGVGNYLGIYTAGVGSAVADVSTNALTVGENSTLNANLTLTDKATLTLNGYGANAATINGNLTLGAELQLAGEEFLEELGKLNAGEMLKLFEVTGEFSGLEATLSIAADAIEETQPLIAGYDATNYYSSLNVGDYALVFQQSALFIKNTATIPEPTTATLSLLALAALAARRRRK